MKKDKLIYLKPLLLEAEISLSINHPNIITYYEIFEDFKIYKLCHGFRRGWRFI